MALELMSAVEPSPKSIYAVLGAPGLKGKKVSSFEKDSKGVLNLVQSIINGKQEVEDPFYVLDIGVVVGLMDKWAHGLPDVQPFYAVKCNPEPALLSTLAALGAGFDCASRAEIEAVLNIGVPADRIVYANPCKAEAQIKYAAKVGVNLTTFDSKDEIEKICKWHPRCAVLIRLKAPDDGEARCPLGPKYGALPEEVIPLLQAAQVAGVAVAGVSFHVGSGATHMGAYRGAIAAAKEVFDAAQQLGMPRLHILNIGGGFTAGLQFDEATVAVKAAVQEHFPGEPGLKLMAEPGRFFAETAFTLATNIIGKRVRGDLREYWINDGIYGSMNCILYDHATVTALPLACTSNRTNPTCRGLRTYASTVFGPTCDALDTVMVGHQLPELVVNDWLVFPNMGAYTASAGSNFNGFATSTIRTHLAYSNTS
ncbi:ornithine decarboxylase 1B, chloroplastic-like [Magnolia sinica]|uniref:ornithine decarboxylase 1B, chloroplastic-like n=1 Tax=Magnolia sinica TaxID=86752 RepID=UPI0026592E2B|nr:ornithine decarboxylase 1B, chloroplastic-like [Magnolia sinica]